MCPWAFFLWASAMAVWLLARLVFKRCPRQHRYQTQHQAFFLSFHIGASRVDRNRGAPWDIQHRQKKKRRSHYTTVSRTSSRLELLTCEFRASRLIRFSFYLQSEQDGIFGEGLFFLRLNNAWNNSSVSITPRQTHTHTHFEATAASCHGKRCWRRGFSTRDFKAVLLVVVVVLIRSQRLKQKKKLHTEMFKDGCCFLRFTRDWCRLGVTDSG